ncbi:hypothetical protein [Sphingomonas parapaucimobilis]|uniref:Uncharacterized protein n=1 Tax=Sphingomonas parapaucimobilis NBRC 15100 TaxID=1219049 RepID=A0A0A1W8T6_9SPHN|nr:hypothetical protein [Sphingomonas parapaucimobilis]GAM01748.1 hypothetical protein SP5_068_01160 [Sphingomonas parapaucimobilis NBRC 15100]
MDEQLIVEAEAPAPEPLPTFADLPIDEKAGTTLSGPGIGGKAKWAQFVEPTRDGQPWCGWEDAEAMLVANAQASMRGQGGLTPAGYKVTRDDSKMLLTLELV